MPTIRVSEKTWKELNRVTREFLEYKRTGFEDVLRISPEKTIRRLIEDWDMTDKKDLSRMEERERNGELDEQYKAYEEMIRKQKKEGTYIDYDKLTDDVEKEAKKQMDAGKTPDMKSIIENMEKIHLEKAKANAKKENENKESEQ